MILRRRIVARGRVQGVFFRDTVRNAATREGVTGWVRNSPDGASRRSSKERPDAVEPPASRSVARSARRRVQELEVVDERRAGLLSGFRIR